MSRKKPSGCCWLLSTLLLLLPLLTGLFGWWAVASGYGTLLWWVGGVLLGGLICLAVGWFLVVGWLLSQLGAGSRSTPRGVRLDATTYYARVNALLALPALTLAYPGAVLLATGDSKTGRHVYAGAPPSPTTVWTEIRAQAAPAPLSALAHPLAVLKRTARQRRERGFSGYYSGEMGASARYGLVPLPEGQTFPPLLTAPAGAARPLTGPEHWEVTQRLVSESNAALLPPQAIIAWYHQHLLAQGWKPCPPRPRQSGYEAEQDWCFEEYVLTVGVLWPGKTVSYAMDSDGSGRYVRVVGVGIRPRAG